MSITIHPNGDITGTGSGNFGQTGTVIQTLQGTFTGVNDTTGTGLVDTGVTKSITVTGSNKVLVSYTCYMLSLIHI